MTRHLGGWWRLWIVLTFLYGVLVASYTGMYWPEVSRISHHPAFIYRMSPEARAVLSRPKSLAELEQALVEADRAGATEKAREVSQEILRIRKRDNWEDVPLVLEMPNGYQLQVASDTKREQANMLGREYVRVLQTATSEARLSAIGNALLIWLTPSIIICALGLAAAWILRGFRSTHRKS
jgi:hypothetical protein